LGRELGPARKTASLSDRSDLEYDLFLGIPLHRAPSVVEESGMTVDGWIPVDSLTLETAFPGVYAIGDVTSVGTPKAGVFSEGQAIVVADQIGAHIRGTSSSARYGGRGICYLDFGNDEVAKVEVTFLKGQMPIGGLEGPSRAIAADKVEFGSSRIRRWFA
jgi:sulfide:quinone oxidoreductase